MFLDVPRFRVSGKHHFTRHAGQQSEVTYYIRDATEVWGPRMSHQPVRGIVAGTKVHLKNVEPVFSRFFTFSKNGRESRPFFEDAKKWFKSGAKNEKSHFWHSEKFPGPFFRWKIFAGRFEPQTFQKHAFSRIFGPDEIAKNHVQKNHVRVSTFLRDPCTLVSAKIARTG